MSGKLLSLRPYFPVLGCATRISYDAESNIYSVYRFQSAVSRLRRTRGAHATSESIRKAPGRSMPLVHSSTSRFAFEGEPVTDSTTTQPAGYSRSSTSLDCLMGALTRVDTRTDDPACCGGTVMIEEYSRAVNDAGGSDAEVDIIDMLDKIGRWK